MNGGGAAWCLSVSPSGDQVAVGCENGTVRIFSIAGGTLKWSRNFDAQASGRILSVAWSPCGAFLAAGTTKSSLSIYEAHSGRVKFSCSLDSASIRDGQSGRVKVDAIVWSLGFTKDGSLWSADSIGNLCQWDISTGTQIQSFNLSTADLYSLACHPSELAVYAAGADQKVYEIRASSAFDKWTIAGKCRVHNHDVRCLTTFSDMLVSGSIDTTLVAYSLAELTTSIKISPHPHQQLVKLTVATELLWALEGKTIRCWDVSGPAEVAPRQILQLSQPEHILAWDVSLDGTWITCLSLGSSTPKLYHMKLERDGDIVTDVLLHDAKLNGIPELKGLIVQNMAFNGSGKLYLTTVSQKSKSQLIEIALENDQIIGVSHSEQLPFSAVRSIACEDGDCRVIVGFDGEQAMINEKLIQLESSSSKVVRKCNDEIFFVSPKGLQIYDISKSSFIEVPKRLRQEISSFPSGILGAFRATDKLFIFGLDFIMSWNSSAAARDSSNHKKAKKEGKGPAIKDDEPLTGTTKVVRSVENAIYFTILKSGEGLLVERPWSEIATAFPPVIKKKLFKGRS